MRNMLYLYHISTHIKKQKNQLQMATLIYSHLGNPGRSYHCAHRLEKWHYWLYFCSLSFLSFLLCYRIIIMPPRTSLIGRGGWWRRIWKIIGTLTLTVQKLWIKDLKNSNYFKRCFQLQGFQFLSRNCK